jgi:hypothetical protein
MILKLLRSLIVVGSVAQVVHCTSHHAWIIDLGKAAKNLNPDLASVVEQLPLQAERLFSTATASAAAARKLDYSLFAGHSSLRTLPVQTAGILTTKTLLACLLLLQGHLDAAHEVILGVQWNNPEEAEYAATHRGETDWAEEHPPSDHDDLVHSIIHRLEGDSKGEGGHAGFENAKYWVAGGPKLRSFIGNSTVVHRTLRRLCKRVAPSLEGKLIAERERSHEIIAGGGGGNRRTVHVARGCFDPVAFIDLCQSRAWDDELRNLQITELLLLVRYELLKLCGGKEASVPSWQQ